MPYILAEPCINIQNKACVAACPVDYIDEGPAQLSSTPTGIPPRGQSRGSGDVRPAKGALKRLFGRWRQAHFFKGSPGGVRARGAGRLRDRGRRPHARGAQPRGCPTIGQPGQA